VCIVVPVIVPNSLGRNLKRVGVSSRFIVGHSVAGEVPATADVAADYTNPKILLIVALLAFKLSALLMLIVMLSFL